LKKYSSENIPKNVFIAVFFVQKAGAKRAFKSPLHKKSDATSSGKQYAPVSRLGGRDKNMDSLRTMLEGGMRKESRFSWPPGLKNDFKEVSEKTAIFSSLLCSYGKKLENRISVKIAIFCD